MKGYLVYGAKEADKNSEYIKMYIEEGKNLGITIELFLLEQFDFGVTELELIWEVGGKRVEKPDFIICRTIHPLLSKQFELLGIPVFNSAFVSETCNHKAKTYQYLAGRGIPLVPTVFGRNENLSTFFTKENEGKVIKSVEGHGGSQVFLYKGNEDEIRKGLGSSDFVIQPLYGNKKQDLRVYIIGTEIIAAVLRTSKDGFRSNFSLGGMVCQYILKKDEIQIVKKIISCFDFGLVGIDFLIGEKGELILNEIEDVVGARMLYQCTNINLVKKYLEFILSKC